MAFRDTFDQCPRCGTTLEAAGAARGCRSCAGMFIDGAVLAEMILEMLPPAPRAFGPLQLSEVKREAQALACPQCGDPMKPTTIHEVELDHCPKHGVWFDQDELRLTLFRAADPRLPLPFGEWIQPPEPWQPPRKPAPPPRQARSGRVLVWEIYGAEFVTRAEVIKIGKLPKSTIVVEDAARMHAVIEVTDDEITVIDLGSPSGTYVNGARVTKQRLAHGDVVRVASADIKLVAT